MNKRNFKLVLDKIKSCPQEWNQYNWHCGTTHCFAGHAQLLLTGKEDDQTVRRDARIFLEVSITDANWLFSTDRSLSDFENFYSRKGFNREGFDREGFDRKGFDRKGFDREGFDREGLDRKGFDREGFDREGLDRKGFDRKGFDCDGLDKNFKPRQ